MARMSHELRTPLNAVKLYGELALGVVTPEDEPELHDDLSKILAAAELQLRLVNEVLEITDLESNENLWSAAAFPVAVLIDEVNEFTGPLIAATHNRLCVVCPPEADEMTSDRGKIRQILRALLSNAFKFTELGEIGVIVEPYEEGDAPWIRFVVTDTGIGMTAEETTRIFDPFQQANSTVARSYDAAGLGLTIASKLAKNLGWAHLGRQHEERGHDRCARVASTFRSGIGWQQFGRGEQRQRPECKGCLINNARTTVLNPETVSTRIPQMDCQFDDLLGRFCYKNQCNTIIATGQTRLTLRVTQESSLCGSISTAA